MQKSHLGAFLALTLLLAGCTPAPTAPPAAITTPWATPTSSPTPCPTPTATSAPTPPPKPTLIPAGEVRMRPGQKVFVRVGGTEVDKYEYIWKLEAGSCGSLSSAEGQVVLYEAPAEGSCLAVVKVMAYSDSTASDPASLQIDIQPPPTVKPDALAEEPDSISRGSKEPFTRLCWVAYSPTSFDPSTTPPQWPSEASVREDMRVLRSAGFDGLVTYGSNYANRDAPDDALDIPALAQEAGFKGIVVGVWDPTDEQELRTAERAAQLPIVVGYCVGNEGLDEQYDLETLVSAMNRLRRATGRPVSTTEQVHDYYENSPLWRISDWIFPNAHPYFSGYRDPQEAVAWTRQVFETLDSVSDKPIVFKEVGLPSDGDADLSETHQAQYYRLLQETDVVYVVFEAFDAPWKHLGQPNPDGTYPLPDPEPHWGIFTSDRVSKEAASDICPIP